MKAKKVGELREASLDELKAREKDLVEQLFHLRFQKATGQLEKPHNVRTARRQLARVLTIANEKRRNG